MNSKTSSSGSVKKVLVLNRETVKSLNTRTGVRTGKTNPSSDPFQSASAPVATNQTCSFQSKGAVGVASVAGASSAAANQ